MEYIFIRKDIWETTRGQLALTSKEHFGVLFLFMLVRNSYFFIYFKSFASDPDRCFDKSLQSKPYIRWQKFHGIIYFLVIFYKPETGS